MRTKMLSVLLLISVGFTACKKDDPVTPKTTQEKLSGKWTLVTTVTNDFYNNASHTNTFTWGANDYVDFRNDGKAYSYEGGTYDTTAYGIVNDNQLWIDDNTYLYDIKSLTETNLQLYRKEIINATDYSEATANAKR